jgi:Neprosin
MDTVGFTPKTCKRARSRSKWPKARRSSSVSRALIAVVCAVPALMWLGAPSAVASNTVNAPKGMPAVAGVGPSAGRVGARASPADSGVSYSYVPAYDAATATGAEGSYLVADPTVSATDYHSLSELAVESSDGQQIVEVGWTVDPGQFGDTLPHLFVFHWVNGTPGCYDGCGFVSSSTAVTAGMSLTPGDTHDFEIDYTDDNWNIYDDGTLVGYFPGSLWSGSFTSLGLTQWFGEVAAGDPVPCTQMGNGMLGSAAAADTISAMSLIGGPAVSITLDQPGAPYYTGVATAANAISIGGPGGCPPVAPPAVPIVFISSAPTAALVGRQTYTPQATGDGSANPVVFTIAAPSAGVCILHAGVVSFTGAGTCDINADQAEDATYPAADQVTQTFRVRRTQKIAFTSTAPTAALVRKQTYTPQATGDASANPVVFTIAARSSGVCILHARVVSFTGAGRCTIHADQAGNATYAPADQATQTFRVRHTQKIAFTSTAPRAARVGRRTYIPKATGGASANPVLFTIAAGSSRVCILRARVVSFTGAGRCTIHAHQAGNPSYAAADHVTQTFRVKKS